MRALLLLWALLCQPLHAMRGSRTSYPVAPYDVGILASFDYTGVGQGGFTWSLSLADPSTSRTGSALLVFVCTDSQLSNNVLSAYPNAKALCGAGAEALQSACKAFARVPANSAPPGNGSLVVTQADTIDLVFAVCPPDASGSDMSSMQLTGSWHAFNANGEELSRGEIPLKQQELDFAIAWLVLGLAFAGNLLLSRLRQGRGEQARAVHLYLLIPPLFFAAEGAIGAYYWRHISATGEDSLQLSLLDTAAWDVASAALVYLIMRLARGWQITRARLSALEERNVALLVALYVFAWAAWQYSYSILSLFALLLSYALILQNAASSTAWSLRLLGVFRAFAEGLGISRAQPQPQPQPAPSEPGFFTSATAYTSLNASPGEGAGSGQAQQEDAAGSTFHAPALVTDGGLSDRQVAFLSNFRFIFIGYLSLDMLCEIASDLLFSKSPWVSYLTQELAALCVWGFLAASFYLRSQPGKSPLFDPAGYLSADSGAADALLPAELQGGGEGGGGGGGGGYGGLGLTQEEEEAGGAARAAALATVAVQARRGQREAGEGEEDRHIIVDAGGGAVVLAERLPPAAFSASSASPPPAAYK